MTYHIYFKDQCIFKNLNKDEFDLIWGRIYRSYHTDDITYARVKDTPKDLITIESSSSFRVEYTSIDFF